jgi:hypothetical protein
MPRVSPHKETAEQFLAAFEEVDHVRVRVRTVLMYLAALHIVDIILSPHYSDRRKDHRLRNELLREHHPHLVRFYKPIYDAGHQARYDAELDFTGDHLKNILVAKRLKGLLLEANKIVDVSDRMDVPSYIEAKPIGKPVGAAAK